MYSVLPDYQGISAGLESFGQRETSKQIEQAYLSEMVYPTKTKTAPIVPFYNNLKQRFRRIQERLDEGDSGLIKLITFRR